MKTVIGIDIGGTQSKIGCVTSKGEIIYHSVVQTTSFIEVQDFVNEIYNKIFSFAKQQIQSLDMIGIGIGAPNANFYSGNIEFAPNLPWKGTIPIKRLFQEKFNLPVVITNDANAAALGEKLFGGARQMSNFVVITLGTGLGSGFFVNGSLLYGNDGHAGELGHVTVFPYGRPCGCGRKGCLETYVSATGLVKTFKEFAQKDNISVEEKNLSAKWIYEEAKRGNNKAIETFRFTVQVFGMALANTVAITSPQAFFIMGGLANAKEFLFNPVKEAMENNLLEIYRNKISILPSQLEENKAALLGAASLIWNMK